MANYLLFALRFESNYDSEVTYQKVVSSYLLSLDMFNSLVGTIVSSTSKCVVSSCQTEDTPYIRKIRISSGDVLIYVYLQKLS